VLQLNGLTERFKLSGLPVRFRLAVAVAVIVIVGTVATFSFLMLRHQTLTLYSRALLPDQLTEVESRLTAWAIPYVETNGQLSVEGVQRNDVLMRLAVAGVPHRHLSSTSEELANVGAMTPQSVLDAQAREGLASDLALGLRGIHGVYDASVIIAAADRGLFADESAQAAKASVRLTLEPGTSLSASTVNGVKTFVADGVPGLSAENVAVMDDRGVALGADGPGDAGRDEVALQTSLQSALDATLGAGVTLVRVHIETDARAIHRREVRRAPILGAPVSNQSSREQYTNAGKSYAKTRSQEDRGSDYVEQTAQTSPGQTKRLSVAVFVDKGKAAFIPVVQQLVAAAAGIDPHRHDSLTVAAIEFPHDLHAPQPVSAPRSLADFTPALPGLLLTLGFAAIVVIFVRPIVSLWTALNKHTSAPAAQPEALTGGLNLRELQALIRDEPPHTAAAVLSQLPSAVAAELLEQLDPVERREVVSRMSRTVTPIAHDVRSRAAYRTLDEVSRV